MSAFEFLAEWALRSSILILCGAAILAALRVRQPAARLTAWTAMLFLSLAMPLLTGFMPKLPVTVGQAPKVELPTRVIIPEVPARDVPPASVPPVKRFDWQTAVLAAYALVALILLMRAAIGLGIGLWMLRTSRPTGQWSEGVEIRESERAASPVTLGVFRPAIVLPPDWRDWTAATLQAVLAHERSHVHRLDPALQLVSTLHRAVLWHSPASWLLHRQIVRIAEEVSDEAAIGESQDRASYARVLLEFMQRGSLWEGVPMARYGSPEKRIDRILSGAAPGRIARWKLAVMPAMALPLAYVAAAAHPQRAAAIHIPPRMAMAVLEQAPVQPAPPPNHPQPGGRTTFLGNAIPSATVAVKSQIDGQLVSVNFKEGQKVHAGDLLATLDASRYEMQLQRAEQELAYDQRQARSGIAPESAVHTDEFNVQNAKLQLSYTRILAPISGIAGLRMVDAGNSVSPRDSQAIVVITQVQPIAVIFTVDEDMLPRVVARLRSGTIPVDAWNRDMSKRLATGRVTAVDNQIDVQTGTAKVKAIFENTDGALFPNQFVNVKMAR